MQRAEYQVIMDKYQAQISNLKKQIDELYRRRKVELANLEQQCIIQHGSHEDDGGFLIGSCVRCGAYLG